MSVEGREGSYTAPAAKSEREVGRVALRDVPVTVKKAGGLEHEWVDVDLGIVQELPEWGESIQ